MNELLTSIVVGNISEDKFRAVTNNYKEMCQLLFSKADVLNRFDIVYSGDSVRIKLIKRGEMRAMVTLNAIFAGKNHDSYTVEFPLKKSPF